MTQWVSHISHLSMKESFFVLFLNIIMANLHWCFLIFWSGNSQEEDTSDQGCIQDCTETSSKQHVNTEDRDSEVLRKARDEGRVDVVFPGPVTQEGCCRFVSEILKCVLYQRQQLPMTYDQLVYSQKKQQASVQVNKKQRIPSALKIRCFLYLSKK